MISKKVLRFWIEVSLTGIIGTCIMIAQDSKQLDLTEAEQITVATHLIRTRGKRADLQKHIEELQKKVNELPEVKAVQTEQREVLAADQPVEQAILKAHHLDDGRHKVNLQTSKIEEGPPIASALNPIPTKKEK